MAFTKVGYTIHPNFINTNTDEIMTDGHILELINHEFNHTTFDMI